MTSTSNSTYRKISTHVTQLRENRITLRRKAGRSLIDILSDRKSRNRLSQEAASSSAGKTDALTQIWRVIITNALYAAERASSGKTKMTCDDIMLPYRLLILADDDDEDNDYRHRPMMTATKMSNKEIQSLIKYCLEMLVDDEATSFAEMELLEMFNYLLSRPEYVAAFRPNVERTYCLSEIQKRFSSSHSSATAVDVQSLLPTAKAFNGLIANCLRLGMGMHTCLSPCIEIVTNWCVEHNYGTTTAIASSSSSSSFASPILPYVFSVVSNLVAAHPEQTVVCMKQHGKTLLSFAKRCFSSAKGVNKDALVDYFSAHLLVSETVGHHQGLSPNDLGYLGSATLDPTQLNHLLQLIISPSEITNVIRSSSLNIIDSTSSSSSVSQYRRQKKKQRPNTVLNDDSTGSTWQPLDKRQRRYLELGARLLRHAQRHYRSSRYGKDDDEACSNNDSNVTTTSKKTKLALSSLSPWGTFVGQQLCQILGPFTPSSDDRQQQSALEIINNHLLSSPSWLCRSPHHHDPSSSQTTNRHRQIASSSPLPYLYLIISCASYYPGGDCWTSSSSPHLDKSCLIHLLSLLLERHGDPSGNMTIQTTTLVALTKLISTDDDDDDDENEVEEHVWGQVVSILFRSDLRYASYTSSQQQLQKNSLGELVLLLLRKCVVCGRGGVDDRVWMLPAFKQTSKDSGVTMMMEGVLRLMGVVLRYNGVSDDVGDNLFGVVVVGEGEVLQKQDGRRGQLVRFCLSVMERVFSQSSETKGNNDNSSLMVVVPLISLCLSAIVTGEVSPLLIREGSDERERYRCKTFDVDDDRGLGVEKYETRGIGFAQDPLQVSGKDANDTIMEDDLWSDFFISPIMNVDNNTDDDYRLRFVHGSRLFRHIPSHHQRDINNDNNKAHEQRRITNNPLNKRRRRHRHPCGDYVPTPTKNRLCDYSVKVFNNIINGASSSSKPIIQRILPLLISLHMLLSSSSPSATSTKSSILSRAFIDHDGLFQSILSTLPTLLANNDDNNHSFVTLGCAIGGLLRYITHLYSLIDTTTKKQTSIDKHIIEWSQSIFESCEKLLKAYADHPDRHEEELVSSQEQRLSGGERGRARRQGRQYDDDDMLDDDDDEQIDSSEEDIPININNDDEYDDDSRYNSSSDDSHSREKRSSNASTTPRKKRRRRQQQPKKKRASWTPSPSSSKRPRQQQSLTNSDNNNHHHPFPPPNLTCAKLLASIMSLLKPSHSCSETIATALNCFNDIDNAIFALGLLCKKDVIERGVRLRHFGFNEGDQPRRDDDSDEEDGTVLSLCLDLISSIRTNAPPSSPHYTLYGMSHLSFLSTTLPPNNSPDISTLISLLHPSTNSRPSRKILQYYPPQRLRQLQSSTRAFRHSHNRQFHKQFDDVFASDIVLPGLDHVDHEVRLMATKSVGMALVMLPHSQRMIVESVWGVLKTDEEDGGGGGEDDEASKLERCVWKDAALSLLYRRVAIEGEIIMHSSDFVLVRERIWHLLLQSTPNHRSSSSKIWERQALRILEIASQALGFPSVEKLLERDGEWLLQQWIETGMQWEMIPLVMCGPSTLRRLLKEGRVDAAAVGMTEDDDDDDGAAMEDDDAYRNVHSDCLHSYLANVASILIPLLLRYMSSSSNNNSSSSDEETQLQQPPQQQNQQHPSFNNGWNYLISLSQYLTGREGTDRTVSKVLRAHWHDVLAVALPLMSSDKKSVGRRMLDTARRIGCLSEDLMEKQAAKCSGLIVREILRRVGVSGGGEEDDRDNAEEGDDNDGEGCDLTVDACLNAIYQLGQQLTTSSSSSSSQPNTNPPSNAFQNAGSSTTECLLHARVWLCRDAITDIQKENYLSVISLVIKEIIRTIKSGGCRSRNNNNTQLGFCLHSLSLLLTDPHLKDMRILILTHVKTLLTVALDERYVSGLLLLQELTPTVANTIVTSLLNVHEEARRDFVDYCVGERKREMGGLRRSAGLLLLRDLSRDLKDDDAGGRIGLADDDDDDFRTTTLGGDNGNETNYKVSLFLPSSSDTAPILEDSQEVMESSYSLLKLFLIDSPSILPISPASLDPFLPEMTSKKSPLNRALALRNERFCLASLLEQFADRGDDDLGHASKTMFEEECERFLSLSRRYPPERLVLHSSSVLSTDHCRGHRGDGGIDQDDDKGCRYADDVTTTMVTSSRNRAFGSLLSGLERLYSVLRTQHLTSATTDNDENNERKNIRVTTPPSNGNNDHSHESNSGDIRNELLHPLCSYCDSHSPRDVRLAASRCLGELGREYFNQDDDAIMSGDDNGDRTKMKVAHNNNIKNENDNGDDDDDDPLLRIQSKCIEMLSHYIQSERLDVSILAMTVAKALLATNEGLTCWKFIKNLNVKRILNPLRSSLSRDASKKAKRLSPDMIPSDYLDELIDSLHLDESEIKDGVWCWHDSIWDSSNNNPNGTTFETWVKNVVCAMIDCCYRCRHDDDNEAKGNNVRGNGQFFPLCLAMSAAEADFAATVFPGIIYDLLSTIPDGDGRAAPADANHFLTKGMSHGLLPSADPKATALVVDTLDLLQNTSRRDFLQNVTHKRNDNTLPNRVYPDQQPGGTGGRRKSGKKQQVVDVNDERGYNANIDPAPQWRGVPYGVVLRLSGVDVALACLRINRPFSALYYADMYADNALGGSGGALERFSKEKSNDDIRSSRRVLDISGFGEEENEQQQQIEDVKPTTKTNDFSCAMKLHYVLKACFLKLNEMDVIRAVDAQASAIRFKINSMNSNYSGGYGVGVARDDDAVIGGTTRSLISLDLTLQSAFVGNGAIYPEHIAVSNHLERLGLRHILQGYLAGLGAMREGQGSIANGAFLSIDDQKTIREKWFQSAWRTLQWDESLFPGRQSGEDGVTDVQLSSLSQCQMMIPEKVGMKTSWPKDDNGGSSRGIRGGFHESLDGALRCLYKQDSESFKGHLGNARTAVLADISTQLGGESIINSVTVPINKLRILNELDEVLFVILKKRSLEDLLQRWGLVTNTMDKNRDISSVFDEIDERPCLKRALTTYRFDDNELVFSVREIALRIMCREDLHQSPLILHLWRFSNFARSCDKPEVATSALSRLRRVFDGQMNAGLGSPNKIKIMTQLQLEEAKISKCRQDVTSAIRQAKLIVSHLQQEKMKTDEHVETCPVSNSIIDPLLSEALLKCGSWMTHYKVESAKTILNNYLGPAADMANNVRNAGHTAVNSKRAAKASFKLAEFVANLYDNVATRIKSQEWKMAGIAAEARQQELKECQKMFNETKRNLHRSSGRSSSGKGRRSSTTGGQSREELEAQLHDIHVHMRTLQKEIEMDTNERKAVEDSVEQNLILALESYGKALSLSGADSDENDLLKHIFRMVSLWFCGSDESRYTGGSSINDGVNAIMSDVAKTVPSYRFVPLTYQLFSRIDALESSNSDVSHALSGRTGLFQVILRELISKIVIEHPYHGIVQLITLSNGNKVGSGVSGRQSSAYLENVGGSKVEAAEELLRVIRDQKTCPSYVRDLIDAYKVIIESYICLAMTPTQKFHSAGGKQKTKNIALSSISTGGRNGVASLDRCLGSGNRYHFPCLPCILTKPPMLRPRGDYGEGKDDPIGSERISGFEPTFSLTETGLHRPKIVVCLGTKGGKYKQLVKGEDDIRQDAVMQQVFSTVNGLFRRRKRSSRRNLDDTTKEVGSAFEKLLTSTSGQLKIATYNIVPLSPASGVLEWVNDTLPFGDYLLDKGRSKDGRPLVGAHSKYYPGEWGNSLCRMHFRNAPANAKRDAFDVICQHFSPAFRFFFLERFSHSPQAWHAARMLYTRSCAVSSIVGHVLGIGDRHSHNILIHQKTGEVVHIDFGIVFEQGKCLATPETVPFRLTRDIVDGMGPTGTDGAFSHAAERTMGVLRENASSLLTILSAVVSDPLYKWSVSPVKARERQRADRDNGGDDDDGDEKKNNNDDRLMIGADHGEPNEMAGNINGENENDAASRAISKIKEKLQGYEDGTAGERQSVEGQVQLLINSARDPDNLCALYFGWCPWL